MLNANGIENLNVNVNFGEKQNRKGISVKGSKDVYIGKNRIEGFDEGVSLEDSERVITDNNDIK